MNRPLKPAEQRMAGIELPSRAAIDGVVFEEPSASAFPELVRVGDQSRAQVEPASSRVHCTAAETERPPTTHRERPPTPAEILDGSRPAAKHHTSGLQSALSGFFFERELLESMATGDQHMANTEQVTQHLPLSPEHEDRSSPQALLVPTQTSDQGVDNDDLEPIQVSERSITGSVSPTQLHRSSSFIEDNKPDVEFLCSRVASTSTQHHGLTTQEIIVILAGYRGHGLGLAGLRRKALLSLLKSYEVSAVFWQVD